MARTRVADFERNLDETSGGFADRKHLRARKAEVRKRFVASEKVDHFHLVSLAWIDSFQRREELIHCKVDNDEIEPFPDRRFPVQLVGSL
jgi:hypothetical protein